MHGIKKHTGMSFRYWFEQKFNNIYRLYVIFLSCLVLSFAAKRAPRYHESTSSFSALAAQSSQLTRSESALYDKDHPSFAGQPTEGLTFQKLSSDMLHEYRQKLGLQEWLDDE